MSLSIATDTDVKEVINSILQQDYSDSAMGVLQQARHYLARAGLLSICPAERRDGDRYFYSKTLLENIEWFWQNNRELMLADQTLSFNDLEKSKIETELKISSAKRFDPSIGQVRESEFSTMFFVDTALPAMKHLVDVQRQIVGILMDILKEPTFRSEQGWRAAVYGGAATRNHLLVHSFNGDLDLAVSQGVMSVNDVDIMVSSEVVRDMLVTLLTDHLRQLMPSLTVKPVTLLYKGHVHTHILKICYDWVRVFSIDISYSDQLGFFDFSGVEPMAFPAYQGDGKTIELPVIGLKNLLTRMVIEKDMPDGAVDSARRRASAKWNLELFGKGDDVVKAHLGALLPPEPVLPDLIPEEFDRPPYPLATEAPNIDQSPKKSPPPDLGLPELSEKAVLKSEQDDRLSPADEHEATVEVVGEPVATATSFHQLVDDVVKKKKNSKGRRDRLRKRAKKAQAAALPFNLAEEVTEEVYQEEAETEAAKIIPSSPLPEIDLPSPEPDVIEEPVVPIIRTEGALEVEEQPHWSEQLTIVPVSTEPELYLSTDVEGAVVEQELLDDGTISLTSTGAVATAKPSSGSALVYRDFYNILPAEEQELPGITDTDMSVVSSRLIPETESDDSFEEFEYLSEAEEPEQEPLEQLWQQSYPVHMDTDLSSNPDKPELEPVLGWATYLEHFDPNQIYLGDKFIFHLRALQARAVRTKGEVIVFLDTAAIKSIGLARLNYQIPDYAFLEARFMPWDLNDGRLLLSLYRARYFHQAFPYLVAIMGDPRSRLFQPASLVKMAKEYRTAEYPANRHYELKGELPEWPRLDDVVKEMTDLLMVVDDEARSAMAKRYATKFVNELEQGHFHAGLGMIILKLGGFSETQKRFLVSRLEYGFDTNPGARWLLSNLEPSKRFGPDGFYLYRSWQNFRSQYKNSLPVVSELKKMYWNFRSLLENLPEDDPDHLTAQLMILDEELYMRYAWLAKNMIGYRKRDASEEEHDAYVLLGHMMLTVYYHLEQNTEFMMDVLRMKRFRGLAKIRGKLDNNYSHTDLVDQEIFKRFLLRLHGAWAMTQRDDYLKATEKLLEDSKDENSKEVVEWYYKLTQKP